MVDSPAAEHQVFISYAHGDDPDFVARLDACLQEHGLSVWHDTESMSSRGNAFTVEIRDAIVAASRVALVIGPRALESEYVTQEWVFALRECKPITPVLRGGFTAASPFTDERMPRRLRRLHRVDCRPAEDAQAEGARPRAESDALREIVRILSEQVGALGEHYYLPQLPEWYVWRTDLFEGIVDAVRSSDPITVDARPSATPGRPQPVAIQGMAGAGKTSLAQAVALDGDVRRMFPDGIFWVDVTEKPAITRRQEDIAMRLCGQPERFETKEEGKERLAELLQRKKVLLILDDVWDTEDVAPFQVDSHGCHILLTTRSREIASHFRELSQLDPTLRTDTLTQEEALEMLTSRLGLSKEQAVRGRPLHLQLVVDQLGLHALAVSIAAAWLDGKRVGQPVDIDYTHELLADLALQKEAGTPFADLDLRRHDERHPGLELSLKKSYDTLGVDLQRCFRALGVFAEARFIDIEAAAAVWAEQPKTAERHLDTLFFAALISREGRRYRQHMLLRSYSRTFLANEPAELDTTRERHHDYYLARLKAGAPSETEIDQALFALEGAPDKVPLIEALIPYLASSPFVWTGVKGALVQSLAALETTPAAHSSVTQLVATLARSSDGQSNRLVVAGLSEHCQTSTAVTATGWLDAWLHAGPSQANGLAARTAARVALLCRAESLLQLALTHPTDAVRSVVIEAVHELWKADHDLVGRLLQFLTSQIRIHKLVNWQRLRVVSSAAVYFSVLLVLRDYADQPSRGVQREQLTAVRPSLTVVRDAWRDVIRACLMVNSAPLLGPLARQVRRTLVGLLASVATSKIAAIGGREYFTYSYEDIVAFFGPGEEQRRAVDQLVEYIRGDANHTTKGLTDLIYELAVRGTREPILNNWVITMAGQFALLAHQYRAPMATANAIFALLERLEPLYPETVDPAQPTASLWYVVCGYPYLSFPYTTGPREEAQAALDQFMRVLLVREFRFRNSWKSARKHTLRVSNLEGCLFGYTLGNDRLGRDVLVQTLMFDIEKDDRTHIAWSPYSLAIGMKRYVAGDVGIQAFDDMFNLLLDTGYFDSLSEQELRYFWQKAADDLILYAGEYQHHFIDLFTRLREKNVSDRLRAALQETENRMSVNLREQAAGEDDEQVADTQTGEALAWALRNALYEENSYFVNLLQIFLHGVARASSLDEAITGLLQRVINDIYGGDIF